MTPAFLIAFIAPVLVFYGLVVLLRRARLRKAAAALDATYNPGGWGRPARIVGRHFTIEITRARKTFITNVEVQTAKTAWSSLFHAKFFEQYPDWEHAGVLKPHEERLFFTHVSFPRYGPPTEEERGLLWRWLNRGSIDRRLSYDELKETKVKRIEVKDERVATTFRGIVTNITRLRRTLAALERLALEEPMGSHGQAGANPLTPRLDQ